MPEHKIIESSLKKIFSGINQLKEALPSKEFTIDGRLVGDIGEAIVQRDYDLFLYEGLTKDYDGETPCGKKVQIKATFKNQLTFKKKRQGQAPYHWLKRYVPKVITAIQFKVRQVQL